MIWTLLTVVAVLEVVYGLYLWRKHTARADLLAATDPEQAAGIRRSALSLAFVFLASPFLLAIIAWLMAGPPDFTW